MILTTILLLIKKKNENKLKILCEQVTVRKKLFNQKIHITFSKSGKKKQLHEIVDEFKNIILSNPTDTDSIVSVNESSRITYDPVQMVGKHISHRFISEDDEEEVWYEGYIVGYNVATCMHELEYVESNEKFSYDLTDDIHDGDLIFLDS